MKETSKASYITMRYKGIICLFQCIEIHILHEDIVTALAITQLTPNCIYCSLSVFDVSFCPLVTYVTSSLIVFILHYKIALIHLKGDTLNCYTKL